MSILTAGVEQRLHLGAQLYVVHNERVVLDFACGEARPGTPMRTDSIVQWYSSGKPLTAICIAQFYESGDLLLDDRVQRFIPEFARSGKEDVTLWQLLTHTAGFRAADNIPRHLAWDEALRLICEAPREPNWNPSQRAGYSTQAAWFILAEVIQRITRRDFPAYIRGELLEPLGMSDSWLSLPPEKFDQYGDRIAPMFDTSSGKQVLAPLQGRDGMIVCRPGASARGPVRQLARLYSMLLSEGELDGRRYLRAETVALFTRRLRVGLYDETFGHTLDYGLGFIINSNRYGAETVPYGYGRLASDETYGHSGAQSSCAFADPLNRLVVSWVVNGMPGERAHQTRQRELNTAIYTLLD
jgi:CubicO group peptidase (beta-lactamase class C family)